jgi:phosphoglucomutase
MPTSGALDVVAAAKGYNAYQTPTGWKYFGNLMDAGRVSLCGEESFGTGGDHIREKDGIWAVLCWLSILAFACKQKGRIVHVSEICESHWEMYGRHFYRRCDYEECESASAEKMFGHLRAQVGSLCKGSELQSGWKLKSAEEYSYTDPIDSSVASKQGIIFCFENGSRIIFRLSGTGSSGTTIRVYLEYYAREWQGISEELERGALMKIALEISQLQAFTGRDSPTVIT